MSASLVQLIPGALTSQTGFHLWRAAHFLEIVTVLIVSAVVASGHPTGAALAEGRSGTLSCNPTQPSPELAPKDNHLPEDLANQRMDSIHLNQLISFSIIMIDF